jgi:hypothetical protein
MLKEILSIIKKIKCKLACCYQSQCSLNENKIDPNNIDEVINNSTKLQ